MGCRKLSTTRLTDGSPLLPLMIQSFASAYLRPIEEAIELAADASGDRQLSRAAGEFADRLRQGASGGETPAVPAVFPPLMGWLLATRRDGKTQRSPARGNRSITSTANGTAAGTSSLSASTSSPRAWPSCGCDDDLTRRRRHKQLRLVAGGYGHGRRRARGDNCGYEGGGGEKGNEQSMRLHGWTSC